MTNFMIKFYLSKIIRELKMRKMLLGLLSIMIALSTSLHAEVPTEESVTKLYVATFNRAPDAAGLNYWLNDSGLQLEEIAQSFFDQPETQEAYPPGSSNLDFVEDIYINLFNRESDQAGLDYWVGELNLGRIEKAVFILAVINGAQDTIEFGNDATILTNKTTVGLEFAKAGLNDTADAIAIMLGVTSDISTVTTALESYGIYVNLVMDTFSYDNGYLVNTTGANVTITDIKYHMVADLVVSGYSYHYDYTFSYVNGTSGTYTFNGVSYDIPNISYGTELSIPVYQNTPLYYALPDYTFAGTGITGTAYYTYTFVTTGGDFTYTSTITYK